MKKDPPTTIHETIRIIRLDYGADGKTTWPFPFAKPDLHQDAAWKARYEPQQLTRGDLLELAEIANAYATMITHPSPSLRSAMHVIHRAWDRWSRS